jgi:ribosomal protein L30/L7E
MGQNETLQGLRLVIDVPIALEGLRLHEVHATNVSDDLLPGAAEVTLV